MAKSVFSYVATGVAIAGAGILLATPPARRRRPPFPRCSWRQRGRCRPRRRHL